MINMSFWTGILTMYSFAFLFPPSLTETIPDDTYRSKFVHSNRLTLLNTESAVNFVHCSTLCRLYNETGECSGVFYNRTTKDCTMKWLNFTMIPSGGKEELFLKGKYFGEKNFKIELLMKY